MRNVLGFWHPRLTLMLAVAALLVAASVLVRAPAEASVGTLTNIGSASGAPGQTLTTSVAVSLAGGDTMNGYDITLSFNANVALLSAATLASPWQAPGSPPQLPQINNSAGTVRATGFQVGAGCAAGAACQLLTLTWNAVTPGTSNVSVVLQSLAGNNGGQLGGLTGVTAGSGTITVTGPTNTPTPAATTATPIPATATPIPPTPTKTPVPPTAPSGQSAATPVPPTATPNPPTATPTGATATPTGAPTTPTAVPTPTSAPAAVGGTQPPGGGSSNPTSGTQTSPSQVQSPPSVIGFPAPAVDSTGSGQVIVNAPASRARSDTVAGVGNIPLAPKTGNGMGLADPGSPSANLGYGLVALSSLLFAMAYHSRRPKRGK